MGPLAWPQPTRKHSSAKEYKLSPILNIHHKDAKENTVNKMTNASSDTAYT